MFIEVQTQDTTIHFHYTISTPTNPRATSIDESLPVVLFLHPVYIASDIFQLQFADSRLRRFNLIALDQRGHGETGGIAPVAWSRAEAATDVVNFMDAIKLRACHMVGVSMGCCVALQIAIMHPDRILSLFDISPLPLEEPRDVAEGRTEIFNCFEEGLADLDHIDEDAVMFAVEGGLQLGFNSKKSSLINALVARTLPQAQKNWAGDKIDTLYRISVQFFTRRKRHCRDNLAKIRCPVMLVHCGADVAYSIGHTKEFEASLREVGVDVELLLVPQASHFGNVTHASEVNDALHKFILAHVQDRKVGPIPPVVVSPFEQNLVECGWKNDADTDYDSDDDFILDV